MAGGSLLLFEYPKPMVRLGCEKCGRAGQDRKEKTLNKGAVFGYRIWVGREPNAPAMGRCTTIVRLGMSISYRVSALASTDELCWSRIKKRPWPKGCYNAMRRHKGTRSVAGELGFEPRFSESESDVLPLNYSPMGLRGDG